jgi:hypothetical protein
MVGSLAVASSAFAQGTIFVNNFDAFQPIQLDDGTGAVDAPSSGTLFQILTGSSRTAVVPSGASPDGVLTLNAGLDGFFDWGFGATAIEANTTGPIEMRAWIGGDGTFDGAAYRGVLSWNQLVGGPIPPPPNTPQAVALNMPGPLVMQIIPEPSTFALAGLGAAALLIFRRRN